MPTAAPGSIHYTSIHRKRYFPFQRDRESSLTTKAQDKQNISKPFEIIFYQKPADKEKIEVTIYLATVFERDINNMAVNIVPWVSCGRKQDGA